MWVAFPVPLSAVHRDVLRLTQIHFRDLQSLQHLGRVASATAVSAEAASQSGSGRSRLVSASTVAGADGGGGRSRLVSVSGTVAGTDGGASTVGTSPHMFPG